MRVRFDIETNGLLDSVSRVHILVIQVDDREPMVFRRNHVYDSVWDGIARLVELSRTPGATLVGHNVIEYDIPALRKLYPDAMRGFREAAVEDTLVIARLMYPDIKERDLKRWKAGKFPGQLIGRHTLEAWGHRLGNYKGDFKGPWDTWTQEMEDYCVQDVAVTADLDDRFLERRAEWGDVRCFSLEHEVAWILARQQRRGFAFDEQGAASLYALLIGRKAELHRELVALYGRFYVKGKQKVPKKSRCMRKGVACPTYYVEGAPYTEVIDTEFNPGSRDHIANRFITLHGWEPVEFTPEGDPKIDETVLRGVDYPGRDLLIDYLTVTKRLGQLAEGKEAWLRAVKDGVIYGRVITNGAVTGRMTHMHPNVAQVPKVGSPYGAECRALFRARKGYVLVGCDAAALELRCLAAYMAKYDGGAYVQIVLTSDDPEVKARGDDLHSVNTRAIGLDPKGKYFGEVKGRDIGKTWFYAFVYGAGDPKLGTIILWLPISDRRCRLKGRATRAKFLQDLPAMGKLVEAIAKAVTKRGFLRGLDGRRLHVRSSHAALNTLLQSAGAVLMKQALVILDHNLQAQGLIPGEDYEFVANVHDEWQIEARPELAELVGKTAVEAIRAAGEFFGFGCPLDGAYAVGATWADTH